MNGEVNRNLNRFEPLALGAFLFAGLALPAGGAGALEAGDGEAAADPSADRLQVERLQVEVEGGAVSVEARGVRVELLLDALALEGGLAVDAAGPLDETVTVSFERLPMLDALRYLLAGRNFALRFGAGGSGDARTNALWVFPRRAASPSGRTDDDRNAMENPWPPALAAADAKARLAAISGLLDAPAERAAEILAAAALRDRDPAVRGEAVYGLGEVGGETHLEILARALADRDHRVREAAVEAVADVGGDASAWVLAEALTDPDASLRERAVHALGRIGGEAAAVLLQQALGDERVRVRDAAAEALGDF